MFKFFSPFFLLLTASLSYSQSSKETLSLIVTGDVLPESSWREPFSPADQFLVHFSTLFAEADEVFINLEEPITTATAKTPYKKSKSVAMGKDFILAARNPIWPKLFKERGVTIVNLANNHMGDYGTKGILDTLELLDAAGLKTVGAGKNSEEAFAFLKIEKKGIKLAILGFTDVIPEGFQATIKKLGLLPPETF